tara:strand:+ start:13599 stop:14120 length:522 start_codon:yes stop_codon:yes gene_type:complete
MVIWISGMPGTGKSTLASYYFKKHKKKFNNLILIDGDDFRKTMNNDLGYTIQDRKKNAKRLTKIVKYLSDQKVNIIISANLIFQKYRNWCKNNISNFLEIYLITPPQLLIKRKSNKKFTQITKGTKNILGKDLIVKKPTKPHLIIVNNSSKKNFLNKIKIINHEIKKKKIKIF